MQKSVKEQQQNFEELNVYFKRQDIIVGVVRVGVWYCENPDFHCQYSINFGGLHYQLHMSVSACACACDERERGGGAGRKREREIHIPQQHKKHNFVDKVYRKKIDFNQAIHSCIPIWCLMLVLSISVALFFFHFCFCNIFNCGWNL